MMDENCNCNKNFNCHDHVQLRVLSGHSSRITALQLNFGRSPLTPVALALITFR